MLNFVSCGEEKLPDFLLSMIQKKHEEKGLETGLGLDIKWRILNWKLASSDETRQLLSKAVAIFHVSIFKFALLVCSEFWFGYFQYDCMRMLFGPCTFCLA